MASYLGHAAVILSMGWMAVACSTDPVAGGSEGADAGSSTGAAATGSTTNDEQTSSSGDDAESDSSSGSQPEACMLLNEPIDIPRLDLREELSFSDVPCDVTDEGFSCTFEKEPELLEVDAVVEGFASAPWETGQSILISGFGPAVATYEVRLVVSTTDGVVLAVLVWNLDDLPEPFEMELEDIGCVDPESRVVPLQATYRLDGEEVSLLGSGSAVLGEYTVYQDNAGDFSEPSFGELGEAATFAILLNR